MNIAVDMSFSETDSGRPGADRYVKNLMDSIAPHNKEHSFFYYRLDEETLDSETYKNRLQSFLEQNRIDLFHLFQPFDPAYPSLQRKWFGTAKVAVTLHDVYPLLGPDGTEDGFSGQESGSDRKEFIRSSDLILVNSENLKREAIHWADLDPDKITVVPEGVDRRFKPRRTTAAELAEFGITKPYVLSLGGMDNRRNTRALIAAFASVNKWCKSSYQLVMIGDPDTRFGALRTSDEEPSEDCEDVVWVSPASIDDLVKLYGGAKLFACPSFFEAAGYPLLEAMACGVPALVTNDASLKDVAGDASYKVNPAKHEEIRAGMMKVLTNEKLAQDLREKGFEQVKRFQRRTEAEKVLAAYRLTCRKKLAIFTPLASSRTGIAEHMDTILPLLSERFECDLFVDDSYASPGEAGRYWNPEIHIWNHAEFPGRADQYQAIVYQLGNTKYHSYMVPYLRAYPGTVVLHDLNLHGLTGECTLLKGDGNGYLSVVVEEFEDRAIEVMQSMLNGAHADIVVNRYYLKNAKSIVVHNEYAKQHLQDKGFSNVVMCRLPVELPVMISMLFDRHFVFASFGRATDNRQIDKVLACLRRLVDQGINGIRYWIVGECEPRYKERLDEIVRNLQLEDYVVFYGYVPKMKYNAMMSQSDVCISLRHPTCGETSRSLLDALANGKPAIVSNVDSFREFPDGAVYKIQNDATMENRLYEAMLALYEDKNLRKTMKQQARGHVAQLHGVAPYVARISTVIEKGAKYAEETQEPPAPAELPAVEDIETDALPDYEPREEPCPEPVSAQPQTVLLQPNRYRRMIRGKKRVSYFSFNLAALPPNCSLQEAVMVIPVSNRQLSVHRISSGWSAKTLRRRRPSVRPRALYQARRSAKSKPGAYEWNCTQLAQKWLSDHKSNHGLYIPSYLALRKPYLSCKVISKS
ncbi:glycosyltransferase [Paenibacillus sp. GCM10012303]|uniref:glycosyltransferase n=1 Tax=Paenibacillus sp. GCM10012303 TaxID=3317340 RepID=UPI003610B824